MTPGVVSPLPPGTTSPSLPTQHAQRADRRGWCGSVFEEVSKQADGGGLSVRARDTHHRQACCRIGECLARRDGGRTPSVIDDERRQAAAAADLPRWRPRHQRPAPPPGNRARPACCHGWRRTARPVVTRRLSSVMSVNVSGSLPDERSMPLRARASSMARAEITSVTAAPPSPAFLRLPACRAVAKPRIATPLTKATRRPARCSSRAATRTGIPRTSGTVTCSRASGRALSLRRSKRTRGVGATGVESTSA